LNPDAYQISTEDDLLVRARDVQYPDGKHFIRVSLPYDEIKFWDSLPYADEFCDRLPELLKVFEQFLAEQKEYYLQEYKGKESCFYRDCANEITSLVITHVDFFGGARPSQAEVRCAEIPGSWRSWWCGYSEGSFLALNCDG
jgi:hypothetical protein